MPASPGAQKVPTDPAGRALSCLSLEVIFYKQIFPATRIVNYNRSYIFSEPGLPDADGSEPAA